MKKSLLFLFAVLVASAVTASAAPGIKSIGESKYSISVGDVEMIVDAGEGGKILSYKLDGKEVIETTRINPFSYGSTFWSSPQKEWSWPPVKEYDMDPYEIEERENSLFLTSRVSPKYQYRFTKEFRIDPDKETIAITYSIKNESDTEKQVAPWEISRVPGDGIMFFEASEDDITPATGTLPFTFGEGMAWYVYDTAPQHRKINADGTGWLAYSNNGLLFIHQYEDLDKTQPAPGEAELQIYVNMGKAYIELEGQGKYETLKPGESLEWTVRWYLVSNPYPLLPSKELAELARKVLDN